MKAGHTAAEIIVPHRISSAEYARLATLYRHGILDTPPDLAFDGIVRDLATSLQVPVAQLVFADAQRFWAKSTVGPARVETLRIGTLADVLIADRATLIVPDAMLEEGVPGDLPPSDLPLRSYAGIRISSLEDDAIGLLHVADVRPRAFAPAEAAAIEAAAHQLSILLESRRRGRHDEDTGALRRDAFEDTVRRLVGAARSGRQRISLVRLDVTAFRASLEAMGTGLGRISLRRLADVGLHQVRRRDCFGRLGQDTFAVLLTDTGEAGAQVLAERLSRHLLQGWSETVPNTGDVAMTITSVKPVIGDDAEAVLLAAVAAPTAPDVPAQAMRRA